MLYAIELQPDIYNDSKLSDFTFSGSVAITLQCFKDTSIITLNMNELSIQGRFVFGWFLRRINTEKVIWRHSNFTGGERHHVPISAFFQARAGTGLQKGTLS